MKKLILFTGLFLASAVPAMANTAWFIVLGYGKPPVIVGGPYSILNYCTKYLSSYEMSDHAHCEYLAYNGKMGETMDNPPEAAPATPKPTPEPTPIPGPT